MLSTRCTQVEVKRREKVFHINGNQTNAEVAILMSGKLDFKSKTVSRDKGSHYIMMKSLIQREVNNYKYICTKNNST